MTATLTSRKDNTMHFIKHTVGKGEPKYYDFAYADDTIIITNEDRKLVAIFAPLTNESSSYAYSSFLKGLRENKHTLYDNDINMKVV